MSFKIGSSSAQFWDVWLWYPMNVDGYTKNVAGYNEKFSNIGLEGFYHSHPVWLSDGGKGDK
jgi:hypothetical protein